ncbi:2731_t:CDS:1, partial [Scutellospora calospora]
ETLNLSPTFDLFLDTSCTFCYTPTSIDSCSNQFVFFWNWFSLNSSAFSFSHITIETFNLLLTSN